MADEDRGSPVTEADFVEAKERLKDLDRVDIEIRKAEQAGLDMSTQKTEARENRIKLQKIIQTYWPGRG